MNKIDKDFEEPIVIKPDEMIESDEIMAVRRRENGQTVINQRHEKLL